MSFQTFLPLTSISASGLSAERLRMEVVANNIANAFSTRTIAGGPFQRQELIFESVQDGLNPAGANTLEQLNLGGVQVVGLVADPTPGPLVFNPNHPDAYDGYVALPNVQIPLELTNLITANRAYEANLKVLQSFRQQAEQALVLLQG